MERLVLLVDDDRLPMRFYIKAIEQKGYVVKHCLEPESALYFARKNASEIKAIVLDIMMPPGRYEDTNEGLKTGVFLLPDLRKHCPDIPVVVLTNVRNPSTLAEFKGKPMLQVVQKMDCPPFELAELVEILVSSPK